MKFRGEMRIAGVMINGKGPLPGIGLGSVGKDRVAALLSRVSPAENHGEKLTSGQNRLTTIGCLTTFLFRLTIVVGISYPAVQL